MDCNLICNYTFPIDLAPNEIPCGANSIGKVQLQFKFGRGKCSLRNIAVDARIKYTVYIFRVISVRLCVVYIYIFIGIYFVKINNRNTKEQNLLTLPFLIPLQGNLLVRCNA